MNEDLKKLSNGEITDMWKSFTQSLVELSDKAITSFSAGKYEESEKDYLKLIDHAHQVLQFLQALQNCAPDEIAEKSETDNLFKRSTQQKMLNDLHGALSISYTYLAMCMLKQSETQINKPSHAYLNALRWNPQNNIAKESLLHCIEESSKYLAINKISLTSSDSNLQWAHFNNLGYTLLRYPTPNYKDAIDAYNNALTFQKRAGTYYGLGIAYLDSGMKEEAINSWMEVKNIDENYDFELSTVAEIVEEALGTRQ